MTIAVEERPGGRSLAERLVDWLGGRLAARDVGRRSFLQRAALVATALTVNPFDFVLKPQTAYASVCGSGAGCGSGWTVFCCSISGGKNTCPSGSYPAGWWKVSGSSFCNGASRYYIDCNRLPGSRSCRCSACANTGTCDRRRYCCNNFRYGQCNQHIAGVTEVVCRVVTCTPPWEWDPACTDTVLVEEATRTHSAPCLPGPDPSPIEVRYQDLGLAGSPLGRPVSKEGNATDGARFRLYERGSIYWHPDYGAHEVYGEIHDRYHKLGRASGSLGFPVSGVEAVGDGRGHVSRFERGVIYLTAETGAHALIGPATSFYRQLGGPRHASGLGYPVSSSVTTRDGGQVTRFEHGIMLWRDDLGAFEVHGAIHDRYRDLGRHDGPLGYPVAAAQPLRGGRGRVVHFETGAIFLIRHRGVRTLHGPVYAWYRHAFGGREGLLGLPVTDAIPATRGGEVVEFENGMVFSHPDVGTHEVHGPILERYVAEGKASGRLGYPVSDVERGGGGTRRSTFEHGRIIYDTVTGEVTVRMSSS